MHLPSLNAIHGILSSDIRVNYLLCLHFPGIREIRISSSLTKSCNKDKPNDSHVTTTLRSYFSPLDTWFFFTFAAVMHYAEVLNNTNVATVITNNISWMLNLALKWFKLHQYKFDQYQEIPTVLSQNVMQTLILY